MSEINEVFGKYRARMKRISMFKSILFALIACFAATGVAALITYFSKASLWLSLGLSLGTGAVVFLITVFVFYVKIFKVTDRKVAEALDALGLEERLITMCEAEENSSVMANAQRADARGKLSSVSEKALKFTVALPVAVMLAISFAFAAGSAAVTAVYAGVTRTGDSQTENSEENQETQYFTVRYFVYEEGTGLIRGALVQTVEKGGFTDPVEAIAEEGYEFYGWTDSKGELLGSRDKIRVELNVRRDMEIFARFTKIGAPDDTPTDGDEKEDDGKDNQKQDDDAEKQESGGNSQQGGEGVTDESGNAAEGRQNNKVVDGTKDYKDDFDREQSEKDLGSDAIPDELKDLLGDYFEGLKP